MKSRIIVVLLACFVATSSYAFWSFLAAPATNTVLWLSRVVASNVTMAKAGEWAIYAHGAALSYFMFADKDETQPTTTSQPAKALTILDPRPSAKRQNPDPKRFNDPAAGQKDVTPKTTYVADTVGPAPVDSSTVPNTASVITAMGGWNGSNSLTVHNTSANQTIYYQQTTNGVTIQYGQSCNHAQYGTAPSGYAKIQNGYWLIEGTTYGCGTLWAKTVSGIQTNTAPCATGYTKNASGNCILSVPASEIMKPAGVLPCEVINTGSGFEIDPKNPECVNLASNLNVTSNSVKFNRSSTEYDEVKANTDGTYTLTNATSSGVRTIQTGPYDNGLDGYSVSSINDSTGTSSGDGSGSGTTTPGSGTGSGECGVSGKPDCSVLVNDAGFDGKPADGDGLLSKIEANDQSITDKISSVDPTNRHGITWDWLPSIPRSSCTPLQYGLDGKYITIDFCETFSIIREALGWFLYIVLAWGLFDMVTSETTSRRR